MATRYGRSSDGSDADGGSTWALAKATLVGASGLASIDTAGDDIYLASTHAENVSASVNANFAGTPASPSKIISVSDAAEPPTTQTAGAVVEVSGANDLLMSGSFYTWGITYKSNRYIGHGNTAEAVQHFDNCTFELGSSGQYISNGWGGTRSKVKWSNCNVKFGATSQFILTEGAGPFVWEGGALTGSTFPSALIKTYLQTRAIISGVDLSAGPSTMNLVGVYSSNAHHIVFRNCKLPASWTGSLWTGTIAPSSRIEMHNCDSGDTNYRLWVEDYAGSIKHETAIVRTGGASDGTTQVSWKMAASANAEYPTVRLESPERVIWNETTGSSVTATIEIVTDNVTLTDAECWLEVMYLGTSGFPLGSWINDAKADVLATAANQATSTETWTTTGLTTPVKQKLSVTFTPQEKGAIHWRVVLCKASTTVYVDPKLTVA